MNRRSLVRIAALALLAAPSALAQDIDQDMNHDEGGGGCVNNRQVYAQGAELCQAGSLLRCDEGSWDAVGDCSGGAEQAPISGGGDAVESED